MWNESSVRIVVREGVPLAGHEFYMGLVHRRERTFTRMRAKGRARSALYKLVCKANHILHGPRITIHGSRL